MSVSLAAQISWALNTSEAQALKIVEIVEQWLEDPEEGAEAFARCESPAERLFLLGFLLGSESLEVDWEDWAAVCNPDFKADPARPYVATIMHPEDSFEESGSGEGGIELYQQAEIDGLRVDFLFEHWSRDAILRRFKNVALAIEIDGHDFHERTKEQAASDRQRDRRLVRAGYRVIRFTGSEVYADPMGVACEALGIARALRSAAAHRDAALRAIGREEMSPRRPEIADDDGLENDRMEEDAAE